jgi:drug/metabolite transporter (DMT)-like permease
MKTAAVMISVAGVVMVSTAPQHTSSAPVNPTAIGYVWLLISVLFYALFEVTMLLLADTRSLESNFLLLITTGDAKEVLGTPIACGRSKHDSLSDI